MSAHTPGPWVWLNTSCAAFLIAESDLEDAAHAPSCYAIADDGSAHGEYGQIIDPSSPDAILIAAAPDLLDALIDVRRALELANFTGELAVVDAAIAKAKGDKL